MVEHVESELDRFAAGGLSEREADRVREHLRECAGCREAEAAVALSRSLLSRLTPASLREKERTAMRAALLERARGSTSARWPSRSRIAFAAAAVFVVFGIGWLLTPHVRFDAAPARVRSLESALHGGAMQRVTTVAEARRVVRERSGVTPPLHEGGGRKLLAIGGASPRSTLLFDIDGRPVVLAVARAERLPDAPPPLFYAKRLEVRHTAGARIFTWTASGDAYSLAVPNGVRVAQACGICHEGTTTLRYIERKTRDM